MVKEAVSAAETDMGKVMDFARHELSSLRAGRANATLLDGIQVSAYNTRMPINQLATITTPQPNLIMVQPWDRNVAGDIARAIQASNIGLNPVADAGGVRVPVPPLSEERRREVVRVAHKIAEQGKVEIREIRRRANDQLKKEEKAKTISEDQLHQAIEQVQKLTDRFTADLDKALKDKEKEIMEG